MVAAVWAATAVLHVCLGSILSSHTVVLDGGQRRSRCRHLTRLDEAGAALITRSTYRWQLRECSGAFLALRGRCCPRLPLLRILGRPCLCATAAASSGSPAPASPAGCTAAALELAPCSGPDAVQGMALPLAGPACPVDAVGTSGCGPPSSSPLSLPTDAKQVVSTEAASRAVLPLLQPC